MNERANEKPELILISGVEGGGVTLYGERTENGWRFATSFVDQTPFMLSDNDGGRGIRRASRVTESWKEALEMLDQLHWLDLPAVMVHRDFGQLVWDAVLQRLGDDAESAKRLDRWRTRCRIRQDGISGSATLKGTR